MTRTYRIDETIQCSVAASDLVVIDHNGKVLTDSTLPFWVENEAIHFRSSDSSDEGIYKWNSVGLTIAVTYEGTEIEFPSNEVDL